MGRISKISSEVKIKVVEEYLDGFLNGRFDEVTLKSGEKIDRYGSDYGSFASPEGISYGQRALAPGTDLKPYNIYHYKKCKCIWDENICLEG